MKRVHGSRPHFPWIVRADSSMLGRREKNGLQLTAASISFPYFALGPLLGHGELNTENQYPIMSLFEWDDRFESAKEWDSEQSYRCMTEEADEKEKIIYVPHVWSLVFDNSEYIHMHLFHKLLTIFKRLSPTGPSHLRILKRTRLFEFLNHQLRRRSPRLSFVLEIVTIANTTWPSMNAVPCL